MELSANPGEGLLQVLQICQQNLSQALEVTQKQKLEIEEIKTENTSLLQKLVQQQEIISELQKKVARNENFTSEVLDLKVLSQSFPKVQNPKVKKLITEEDDFGNTKLHKASKDCNPRLVQRLIELGADVNANNNELSTPLHEAMGQHQYDGENDNYLKTFEVLLQNGANIHAKNFSGQTPLHFANSKIAPVLIQNGGDVTVKDVNLQTPLHRATQRRNLKTVELLIQHGADVNARAYDQSTPLHSMAKNEYHHHGEESEETSKIVELLIKNGADVNAMDDWQRTPQSYGLRLPYWAVMTPK